LEYDIRVSDCRPWETRNVGAKRFAVDDREVRDGNRSSPTGRHQSSLRFDVNIAENASNVKTLARILRRRGGTDDEFGVHGGREVDEANIPHLPIYYFLLVPITVLPQHTQSVLGIASVAHGTAVGNEVQVERVIDLGRDKGLEQIVGLLAGRPVRGEAQPPGHPVDVGIDGKGGPAQREEEDDGGGLGADAGHGEKPRPRLFQTQLAQKRQLDLTPLLRDAAQRLLDAGGLGGGQSRRTDRLDQFVRRRVADRLPGGEPLPQPLEGPVPVDVVGVLGDDGGDERGDGVVGVPGGVAVCGEEEVVEAEDFVGFRFHGFRFQVVGFWMLEVGGWKLEVGGCGRRM
jgi:hypothetical protein